MFEVGVETGSETDTASTDLVMCHSVLEVGVKTGSETDTASTDLVICHSVLEVGVETGSELQQPGPLGLQRGHVGLHDAGGRMPVQDESSPFLLHCVEVTLSRLQLTNETLQAKQ